MGVEGGEREVEGDADGEGVGDGDRGGCMVDWMRIAVVLDARNYRRLETGFFTAAYLGQTTNPQIMCRPK